MLESIPRHDGGGLDHDRLPAFHRVRNAEAARVNRWLIAIGIVLLAIGLVWPWLGRLGLGHLPGDIVIERDGFRFYFPITTMLVVSAALSLLLTLISWLQGR